MTPNKSSLRPIDCLLLGFFQLVPLRLARHFLFLLGNYPSIADRWGYHIRPIHFYEPLPDFSKIRNEDLTHRREFPTIDFHWPEQLSLLRQLGEAFAGEVQELAESTGPSRFDFNNDYFAGFDAALYYALIRKIKPQQIVEIGCGFSTQIADKALKRNRADGWLGTLTCIEPYPQARLMEAGLDFELIEKPVEHVDLDTFTRLNSGDVLFIDSSHALKTGGDVCREFLEILPVLKPGVYIHVHDIFFPHDYPSEWLIKKRYAFNEQYILEAFLAHNEAFSIIAAAHWLKLDFPDLIAQLWPVMLSDHFSWHGQASFWMRKN